MSFSFTGSKVFRWGFLGFLTMAMVLGIALPQFLSVQAADVNDGLDVEIIAAYNLIVDSNVMSPSTEQPIVATVIGKFCNTDASNTLTNVIGHIGDYMGDGPGDYPDHTPGTISGGGVSTTYDGTYQFQHLGGTADATRYIGTLAPGQCNYQYWSFTYPKYANWNGGTDNIPAWGTSVKPGDDLWLQFDIWGTGSGATTNADDETWTMYLRNEISAMANKIKPNGNPGGLWFNTDTSTVYPGETITTNGILYRLGNINKGFDNNSNGVPDYNAWLQPFGNPAYDPSCFRLVSTSGVLTVTTTSGEVVIPFSDNLYFTDLPQDNTNVEGLVYYEFLALGGACTIPISPYQEAASGYDNEKFNGDYGTGIPPLITYEPEIVFSKTDNAGSVAGGGTLNYSIPFYNNSFDASAGLTLSTGGLNLPLAFEDTVPNGAQYDCGTAAYTLDFTPNNGVSIYYSNDSGTTWSTDENSICSSGDPTSNGPNNLIKIRWWLNDPLPKRPSGTNTSAGEATFSAIIPSTFVADAGTPIVENCVVAGFGDGEPFGEECDTTLVEGNNSIGDEVYSDDNANGVRDVGESVLPNIDIWLYWDQDGDGVLDDDDPLVNTSTTDSVSAGNYLFSNLPDARFIVVLDTADTDIPAGYRPINPDSGLIAVDVSAVGADNITTADFGLGPALALTKTSLSKSPIASHDTIEYKIELKNQLPGDGTTNRSCVYYAWSSIEDVANTGTGQAAWLNTPNIFGSPDTAYSVDPLAAASEKLAVSGFTAADIGQTITDVDLLLPIRIVGTAAGTFQVRLITYGASPTVQVDYGVEQINTFTDGVRVYPVWQTGDPVSPFSSWSAYAGNVYSVELEGKKSGSLTDLEVDAVGFRITTTGTCGNNSTDITVLPLTDSYDPAVLEYVSSSVNPDSITPAGTLTWNNVGPLYAGGSRDIYVTFRVRTDAPTGTNNTATSTNARFGDGKPTNSPVSDSDTILGIVGDRVWFDINGDNFQDAGEPGIPGVTVQLCDSANCNGVVYATAITDDNGNYIFSGLALGTTYYVRVTDPASPPYDNGTTGASNPLTFTPTASNVVDLSYDWGYDTRSNNTGGVDGYVWNDINADGVIDTGETGFSGITVELCEGTEPTCTSSLGTTTTDASGYYQFANISAGTNSYFVRVTTPPASTTETYEYNTICSGSCNDATINFSVVSDSVTHDINLGYLATGTASIGDFVWRDWDGDGLWTAGEEGINGINVRLYLDNDNDGVIDTTDYLYASQTTYNNGSTDGYYLFNNLPAGNWIVVVSPPSDHYQTYDPDETAPCSVCNSTSQVTTTSSSTTDTQDYAYKPTGTGEIGDLVYHDQNGDGNWDTGEPGLPNITVNLYEDTNGNGSIDAADALITTQVTDQDGNYLFENLYLGRYLVDVDTTDSNLPVDGSGLVYILTTGNDPNLVVLSSGSPTDYTADFGFMPRSSIGDLVWRDDNGNAQWETNEPGISGVVVNLYLDADNDGVVDGGAIATDTTDSDGLYRFNGLFPNNYIVEVDTTGVLAGFTQTGDPDDTDLDCSTDDPGVSTDTCDNRSWLAGYSVTVNTVTTNYLGLEAGQNDMSRDFGYQPQGVLGDMVWIDTDNDGVRDLEEQGISDVTVWLCTSSPCNASTPGVVETTTDENGEYGFGELTNGQQYYVAVDSADLPIGLTQTFGTPEQTRTINTGVNNGVDLTVDFGYRFVGLNTINGTVWNDADSSKTIAGDSSEDTRYANVPVYLWNCGAGTCSDGDEILVGSKLTDSNGYYSFTELAGDNTTPVTYRVVANSDSYSLRGTITTTPVSVDPSGADSPTVTFNSSTPSTVTRNFGYLSTMDFGDFPVAYNNTLLVNNGARHTVSSQLYLGGVPDYEANGQESTAATADGTDEDGVSLRVGAANAAHGGWTNGTVASGNGGALNIQIGGTWSGVPQVFIDFDGADTTYSLTEVTLRDSAGNPLSMPLSTGTHSVYFDVPSGTFDGVTTSTPIFIRVRLSSTGGLGATGLASNGEVEDYMWNFGPNAITLADFSVRTSDMPSMVTLFSLLLAGIGIILLRIRRQKAAVWIRHKDE